MAFSESANVSMTVLASGHIEVKRVVVIYEDGVEIARRPPHRHVLEPGASLEGEDARVTAVAGAVWTPAVIAAHETAQAVSAASLEI